jgi:hypothetical protein
LFFKVDSQMELEMTRDEMLADLAYARTLAEEGRQAPLVGGAYLIFFGVLIALCYLIQWAALTGALPIRQLDRDDLGNLRAAAFIGISCCGGVSKLPAAALFKPRRSVRLAGRDGSDPGR